MSRILLQTERLTLRRFTPADLDRVVALDADPEVMRYLSGGAPTPRHVIEAEIFPRLLIYDERRPHFGFWAAIERAGCDFLGWFTFRPAHEDDPTVVKLGFRLRRAAWGKGFATEGARALIRLGFTECGV